MDIDLFKPTIIKHLCAESRIRPSKKYGQNYLTSKHVVEKMLNGAELQSSDTILEIGPGFGCLTFALAPKVKKVIAFEIEKKLQKFWQGQVSDTEGNRLVIPKNVDIVWGNALASFLDIQSSLPKGYKVVANLPYQISSHVLRLFLDAKKKPERMVVMLQKEVVDRIRAKPGDMSLLSVAVQYYGDVRVVTKVSSGSFWPQPKVHSAVISISDIKERPNAAIFFKVVRAGFTNKRKQLWRNLQQELGLERDVIQDILKTLLGNEKVRAQELSITQWEDLVEILKSKKMV